MPTYPVPAHTSVVKAPYEVKSCEHKTASICITHLFFLVSQSIAATHFSPHTSFIIHIQVELHISAFYLHREQLLLHVCPADPKEPVFLH